MKFILRYAYTTTILILLTSCSSTILDITSSTPARIESGGQFFCQTPCYFENSWDFHKRTLEAFPLDKSYGTAQVKNVTVYAGEKNEVYFDMESSVGIKSYASKELRKMQTSETDEVKKEKELKFLKKMHDQGTIGDKEYIVLLQKAISQKTEDITEEHPSLPRLKKNKNKANVLKRVNVEKEKDENSLINNKEIKEALEKNNNEFDKMIDSK